MTMSRDRILPLFASLLTTLGDIPSGKAPAGILYAGVMAAGYTLDEYNTAEDMLRVGNCVTKEGNILTITSVGMVTAKRIKEALAAKGVAI